MKKALLGTLLVAGMAFGVNAQENSASNSGIAGANLTNTSTTNSSTNVGESQTAVATTGGGNFALTSETGETNAAPSAFPMPAEPSAKPKYVFFGDRDDYRWQLGVGFEYFRFQSSAFNANMVGLNTSLTYYTNSWFAVEGSSITGFGPTVFDSNNHAKIFGGTGGIRIGSRQGRWEPFGHANVGGSHLEPQTAYGGKNALMALVGGGIDFRVHSRLSFRGEADWIYTTFFSQTQNNFQIVGGMVLHF
jgi:hypothetical protein